MSTPWSLRRIRSLDPSSLDFLRQVYALLRHDEEEQYLPSLQGQELARLVDLLDRVLTFPSTFQVVQSRDRSYRALVPYLSTMTFPDIVCTNYKWSAVTM